MSKFCRDCRHYRDLEADQAAEEAANAPSGFWGFLTLLGPPLPPPYPIFTPRRCLRETSLVTGEPLHLDADHERSSMGRCGEGGRFWGPTVPALARWATNIARGEG